ncbi:hypothetical protein [Chryseobacterium proteolyticum]|uniref:hypothetical protein n=1 Tax=Chryseobacterium proteolyticum TaxID=118127 RepID=UPI003982E701
MVAYKITLESIKNLKSAFDYADNFADNNADYSGYGVEFNNEELVNSYNEKANNEAKLIAEILNVPVCTVIDMAFDFDFAKNVLNQVYAD